MPLWYPDRDDVELVRRLLAARFFPEYEGASPSPFFGVVAGQEGEASLDSALNLVRQPYYTGIHNKAGALLRSMIKNHPFVDGNKRIALVTTVDFLLMNDHILVAIDAEMVQFALEIAQSEPDMPWEDIAAWVRRNCVSIRASKQQVTARLAGRPEALPRRLEQIREALEKVRQDYRRE